MSEVKGFDELLRDFHSLERWEKAVDTFQEDKRPDSCIENRDLLIQKYRSKFPQSKDIPLDNQKLIRL